MPSRPDATTRREVALLSPMSEATLLKPVEPANYTDFYASIHHATNVGRHLPARPAAAAQLQIRSHRLSRARFVDRGERNARAAAARPDQTRRRAAFPASDLRSCSTTRSKSASTSALAIALGEPIPIGDAGEPHLRRVAWSTTGRRATSSRGSTSRSGRFLPRASPPASRPGWCPWPRSSRFAFPLRCAPTETRNPLPYLCERNDQQAGAIDLTVEAFLLTHAMRAAGLSLTGSAARNLRDLYWTPAQLIAHHTSNGCNLLPGDLLATGTVSGAAEDAAGCLLELTAGGAKPVLLPNGEKRTALEDGDEVILRGFCRRAGFPQISLGECRGMVLPVD